MAAKAKPATRTTLADEVHDKIRSSVVSHELEPGSRLSIDGLAAELGVSATPVREALTRLASEGLASYEPLVGYRVEPGLGPAEFDQLTEARAAIEIELARLAAARRTEAHGGAQHRGAGQVDEARPARAQGPRDDHSEGDRKGPRAALRDGRTARGGSAPLCC